VARDQSDLFALEVPRFRLVEQLLAGHARNVLGRLNAVLERLEHRAVQRDLVARAECDHGGVFDSECFEDRAQFGTGFHAVAWSHSFEQDVAALVLDLNVLGQRATSHHIDAHNVLLRISRRLFGGLGNCLALAVAETCAALACTEQHEGREGLYAQTWRHFHVSHNLRSDPQGYYLRDIATIFLINIIMNLHSCE
jgi:hypothetical protein